MAGADRTVTAVELSRAAFQPGVPVVFIATGGNFADALSAGPAAAKLGGPILLAGQDLPAATAEELARLQPQRIVIVGGDAAVSGAVQQQLGSYSGNVERWAGSNRFATSTLVSSQVFEAGSPVYVATGDSFPDALSGGVAAGVADGPVLLVSPDEVPDVVAAEIARLEAPSVTLLGGEQAISSDVQAALGENVSRVAGADRFETAAQVARTAFPAGANTVFVATGADFADALAGVPVAATSGGPILLVTADDVPAATAAAMEQLAPQRVVVLGGTAAVSDSVMTELGANRPAQG